MLRKKLMTCLGEVSPLDETYDCQFTFLAVENWHRPGVLTDSYKLGAFCVTLGHESKSDRVELLTLLYEAT